MSFLDDLKSAADNFVGNATGVTQAKNTLHINSLPWKQSVPVSSRYWSSIDIDHNRWNQLFPYRLVVVDATTGQIVGGGIKSSSVSVTSGEQNNTIVNFIAMGSQWVFRLPITPQQLNITDQYAINTTATLRGILEEHGGLKFKIISCAGTMGVWPYRTSVTSPPKSPTILQSLFGGTIAAATNVVNQFSRVINAATSGHPANKPKTLSPLESDAGETSTGYYQALALQQFLEQYAEAKKDPNNASWRLVFDIPKQNQSFVVTPMQFAWQQMESKPTSINYTFQLKAWRRIDLKQKVTAIVPADQTISPGILQRILTTISEARKLMSSLTGLIGAVRSDIERPLDVLRQTALFVKDAAGVAATAADLPFQIQKDYSSSIKDSLNILKDSISTTSSDPAVRTALAAVAASALVAEGLSLSAVSGGQLGTPASQAQSIDPANNIFRNPEQNFSLMDQVPVSSMSLTPAQQNTVDNVLESARQITVDDLKVFRAVIQDLSLQISNNFGSGDPYYSKIYNKPLPTPRISPMTVDEYELLKALYDTMQSYDILTANNDVDDANRQNSMEYVAGLADASEIPFQLANSKILAPVPFGLTMEAIALRYLGDPQRWIEIATLNNLRDPYIDENGFQLPLLSNATGRQITVSNVENLYIGQRVLFRSTTQIQSARIILGIDRLSDTSFLLTLDGLANLDNFVTADLAYLQAYLPGTVNSQQKIFIPSDLAPPDDPNITIPASTAGDPLVGLSKVDLLLTDTGDLAVNNYGDFRFAAGITNIIQALKIKIATPKGTWIAHPTFGLGIRAGIISSDVNIQDIYDSLNKLIEEDPRFNGLDSLQINISGPTLSINMGVTLAGTQGVFPLTFQLSA